MLPKYAPLPMRDFTRSQHRWAREHILAYTNEIILGPWKCVECGLTTLTINQMLYLHLLDRTVDEDLKN